MEEIKLPKFKTKEELEQFAMGLLTENESLKKVITLKDETIKSLDKQLGGYLAMSIGYETKQSKIQDLESEIKSLKEKESGNYYKGLYSKERERRIELSDKCFKRGIELEEAKRKVHKLCSMVTFMFGLLPWFKGKRVRDTFGEFDIADYRL